MKIDKLSAWNIFEKSGKINDYLNYTSFQQALDAYAPKGDLNHANNYRCNSDKGKEIQG